jgi:S-adenosylmethionine hydrolase
VSPITLLTDFGLLDTYVAQVKGAILSVAPETTIIDLTHAVPPQDVKAGAYLLWSAVIAFPPRTVHVAVVDPGVGSSRRAVALETGRGDVLVGPDNGLLWPACERLGSMLRAVELTDRRYWRPGASSTFHGRDIFGPAAAHIASGVSLERLGRPADELMQYSWPWPGDLAGEVIHVDGYGNLITNMPADRLPAAFEVTINGHVATSATHYAAVRPGTLLAVRGSAGLLEISVRDGSAAARLGAARGTRLQVSPQLPRARY